MSAPTKIYLVLVAILTLFWLGFSKIVEAESSGPQYLTDPRDLLDRSDKLTAMLRGRVEVRSAEGEAIAPPEGTLEIDVRARDAGGTLAVQRIGTVQPDGVFEVLALPHGLATVAIKLGGGETVWECEDIVVGGAGILDPRIDPIDLGDELFFFDVEVRGPSGEPASEGQLAWRKVGAATSGDQTTFDGLAPLGSDGRARFFSTTPVIDAVCMVPGARTELFEELYVDSTIDLGPGVTIELVAMGELPDPSLWSLRAVLTPESLVPAVELSRRGFEAADAFIYAELDRETGSALIPVARGGRYRIQWGALRARGQRFQTIKLPVGDVLEVPPDSGLVRIESTFPIEAFLAKAAKRRYR